MYYASQGLMTAADIAEVRRDMDLDLCSCCETQQAVASPDEDSDDGLCDRCGHESDDHLEPTA